MYGMSQTQDVSAGFLYDNGMTPVCCTPEYLAAYGVGLDSTYGDGLVQGVLREDQAEEMFFSMYSDKYDAFDAQNLQYLTEDLKNVVALIPGVEIPELMEAASRVQSGEQTADEAIGDVGDLDDPAILTELASILTPEQINQYKVMDFTETSEDRKERKRKEKEKKKRKKKNKS